MIITLCLTIEKYLFRWSCHLAGRYSRHAYAAGVVLLGLLVATQCFVLIATKRHYTVDVLVAMYVAPMHWFMFELCWPDPPLPQLPPVPSWRQSKCSNSPKRRA